MSTPVESHTSSVSWLTLSRIFGTTWLVRQFPAHVLGLLRGGCLSRVISGEPRGNMHRLHTPTSWWRGIAAVDSAPKLSVSRCWPRCWVAGRRRTCSLWSLCSISEACCLTSDRPNEMPSRNPCHAGLSWAVYADPTMSGLHTGSQYVLVWGHCVPTRSPTCRDVTHAGRWECERWGGLEPGRCSKKPANMSLNFNQLARILWRPWCWRTAKSIWRHCRLSFEVASDFSVPFASFLGMVVWCTAEASREMERQGIRKNLHCGASRSLLWGRGLLMNPDKTPSPWPKILNLELCDAGPSVSFFLPQPFRRSNWIGRRKRGPPQKKTRTLISV